MKLVISIHPLGWVDHPFYKGESTGLAPPHDKYYREQDTGFRLIKRKPKWKRVN